MEHYLRVLLVEDSEADAKLIERELKKANGYTLVLKHVESVNNLRAALNEHNWDIVICDFKLTGFDAFRVLDILDELGLDIPFFLISGVVTDDMVQQIMRMGANGYLSKDNLKQLPTLIKRELKLASAYDELLKAWAQALEFRDTETRNHSERVVDMTIRLSRKMGIAESKMIHIRRGALLHDIGKLGVSDTILLKKGELTEEETKAMQRHAEIGYYLLKGIGFLKAAADIPHYHHERWDGSGYPMGLEGEEIPLPARIFSVVDTYDAMTSDRPYRLALPQKFVLEYIKEQSGTWFDPAVVKSFLEMVEVET